MLFLILIMTYITVFLLFRLILGVIFQNSLEIRKRLLIISKLNSNSVENELDQPFISRVLRPMLDRIGRAVLRITPREITSSLEKKITMAGNPNNITVKDVINIQLFIFVSLPLLTAFIGYSLNSGAGPIALFALAEIAIGLVMPGFILSKMITARQKRIRNSLPDVIDLLTVSVEAGLGFDSALMKVVGKMPGPLASEFENVLQEIKIGKQKKEALKAMADRIGINDMNTFVGSVIQADQFGVSIGSVLRIQSEQMRQKRKQRTQEKAMKAPIKMLIPMVLFILPTLFSVLLGPVVIQIMEQFSK